MRSEKQRQGVMGVARKFSLTSAVHLCTALVLSAHLVDANSYVSPEDMSLEACACAVSLVLSSLVRIFCGRLQGLAGSILHDCEYGLPVIRITQLSTSFYSHAAAQGHRNVFLGRKLI